MPVSTRSQSVIGHHVAPDDPRAIARAHNTTDPISFETIADIEPGQVFLHRVSRSVTHAYDAVALSSFICRTGDRRAPLSRVPLTVEDMKAISIRAHGNKYYVLANMRFVNQCKRMPSSVTRWQHLDWCLALIETMFNDLHGNMDEQLDRNDLFTMVTMINTMIIPAIEKNAHLLSQDANGRETVVLMLSHYMQQIWQHSKCTSVHHSFLACKELALMASHTLAGLFNNVV